LAVAGWDVAVIGAAARFESVESGFVEARSESEIRCRVVAAFIEGDTLIIARRHVDLPEP
jgi:hypothetical protein